MMWHRRDRWCAIAAGPGNPAWQELSEPSRGAVRGALQSLQSRTCRFGQSEQIQIAVRFGSRSRRSHQAESAAETSATRYPQLYDAGTMPTSS